MWAQLDLLVPSAQNGLGGAIRRFGLDTRGQKWRHLGGRSELRAGSLGEEWGGDNSRESEEMGE